MARTIAAGIQIHCRAHMKTIQVGMIGGGSFGKTHLRSILLDGTRRLVAGVLKSQPAEAMRCAQEWGVRGYPDYQAMIDACKRGTLNLDYVVIVTPNDRHYEPAKACVRAGIPVFCEKPMTGTVAESEDLLRLVQRTKIPFVLSHTYTGHPMMMLARELIKAGEIGAIRKVESWYNQCRKVVVASKTKTARQGAPPLSWKTDPRRAGISYCGNDIGVHAFVAATWVTGLAVKKVSARLNVFQDGMQLDDDFNVIAEMDNGATALITATKIAVGYRNDNGFRIFGVKGSLEWRQESAEKLLVRTGDYDRIYWLGKNYSYFPRTVASYLRMSAGHNEDFLEALANLHCTMERKIRIRRGEQSPEPYDHPGAGEGLAGMKFIAAAVRSSRWRGKWTQV